MTYKNMPETWLFCHNINEWHEWLAANHRTVSEVWLQIKKAKSKDAGIMLGEAVEEAICFGWIDGRMYSVDADKFILRFTPRRPGSVWSLINKKRAESMIAENRMTDAGMAKVEEAKANGRWDTAYTSARDTKIDN